MAPQRPRLFGRSSGFEVEESRVLAENFNRSPQSISSDNTLWRAMSWEVDDGKGPTEAQMWHELETIAAPQDLDATAVAALEEAKKHMMQAWKDLVTTLPPDDKPLKASKNPRNAISKLFGGSVADKPENASTMEKFKRTMQDWCSVLDDYSGVLNFIPTEDKYVKVVTGVLTTVVQATARHKNIKEEFATTLEKIKHEFQYCLRVGSAVSAESNAKSHRDLRSVMARFFTEIFRFLVPYVKWCKSSFERTKAALNNTYFEDFIKGPLTEIRLQTAALEREIGLQSYGVGLESRDSIKQVDQKVDKLEDRLISIEKNLGRRNKIFDDSSDFIQRLEIMGSNVEFLFRAAGLGTQLNENTATKQIMDSLNRRAFEDRVRPVTPLDHLILETYLNDPIMGTQQHLFSQRNNNRDLDLTFKAIERASEFLEPFADDTGYPLPEIELRRDIASRQEIFSRLMEWVTMSNSQTLWLCGPICYESPSEITIAAGHIAILAEDAKLPIIKYRCRQEEMGMTDPLSDAASDSIEMSRFVVLIYSLIRQTIWLLPEKIHTTFDFSRERFANLQPTSETILDALTLLEQLLVNAPKMLLIVIDGFELIDNDTDLEHGTGGYVDVLLEVLKNARKDRILKLLLASDGKCLTLMDDEHSIVDEQVHTWSSEGVDGYRSWEELAEEVI